MRRDALSLNFAICDKLVSYRQTMLEKQIFFVTDQAACSALTPPEFTEILKKHFDCGVASHLTYMYVNSFLIGQSIDR